MVSVARAGIAGLTNFRAPDDCVHLYQHFLDNKRILGLDCDDDELLLHTGRDVCRMILARGRPEFYGFSRRPLRFGITVGMLLLVNQLWFNSSTPSLTCSILRAMP